MKTVLFGLSRKKMTSIAKCSDLTSQFIGSLLLIYLPLRFIPVETMTVLIECKGGQIC